MLQALVLQSALSGPLAGGTLLLPIVLGLGLSAGAAWMLFLLPSAGVLLGAALPAALARVDGRLRLLTIALAGAAAFRAPLLLTILILSQLHLLDRTATLIGVGAVIVVCGILDGILSNALAVWYGLLLPDAERRRLLPRLGTLASGASTLVLWMLALLMSNRGQVEPSLAIACFAVAFAASLIGLVAVALLPDPGRVLPRCKDRRTRVVRPQSRRRSLVLGKAPTFGNLCISSTLAAMGGGLMPALALLALGPMGLPPSFTVLLAAVSSSMSLVGSAVAATFIGGLSASRVMRATHVVRIGEIGLVLTALVFPSAAPVLLLSTAVLEAFTSAANGIAGSELLYRISGAAIAEDRGRYTALTHGAYTLSALAASSLVAATGSLPVLLLLLSLAGGLRLVGAAVLAVSPRWRDHGDAANGTAPLAPRSVALPEFASP